MSDMFTLAPPALPALRHASLRLDNRTGAGCKGYAFDPGLTPSSGTRRAGYFVFKRRLAGFLR